VGLYLHSPNTSSWHGPWLSTRTILPLLHPEDYTSSFIALYHFGGLWFYSE